jgi:hypothetical protein
MLVVLRRFWIEPGTFGEFERISREEIWPPIEAVGARVQGLFLAEEPEPHPEVTGPCEMAVLLMAYVDHDHWTSTRPRAETWGGTEEQRLVMAEGVRRRHALTLHTEPTFMRSADVSIGGPFFSSR